MLVFASEFPTGPSSTIEDFLDVCRIWLTGSPRYPWSENDLPPPEVHNETIKYEADGHVVKLVKASADGVRIGAMQHSYREENFEWVTELVAREMETGLLASVRVHCTSLRTGIEVPWARKPYVIRQLLQTLGGGDDGGLKTGEEPHYLSDGSVDLAAEAISGRLRTRLPIVYVSVGADGRVQIDPGNLSRWLSGMAHVLVEPTREFSYQLMRASNGVNAYGGAIGLYWPDGGFFEKTFVGSRGPSATARYLESKVQAALCQSQPTDLSTWMAVRALIASDRISALRSDQSADINEWVEAFDEERQSLQEQLDEAKVRISGLTSQLHAVQTSEQTGGLLGGGQEQDLFPGERAEIVQDAIREALASSGEDSRRGHVLRDLVSENQQHIRESLGASVKNTLQGKMKIGSAEIRELEELGFNISDEGKHLKAIFRNDPRYTFTLHKTASDHRTPKNLVALITRKLFR